MNVFMINKDGIFPLILAILVLAQFVVIPIEWRKRKIYVTILFGIVLIVQLISTMELISLNWGAYPWGRTSAFKTADSFLTTMKQGDYDKATEYMLPCAQDLAKIYSFGDNSKTRPVSWQWTGYEYNSPRLSVIGTAKFIDGVDLRIEIEMKWNGRIWQLNGVIFGEPYKDARIQFDC